MFSTVDIARVAHEANRALQIITNDPAPSPPWDEAPDWQQASAVEGVERAVAGATPEQLHEEWCDFKTLDDWRWGPVKDADAKTHPCLRPYAELPEGQKAKDDLFAAVVTALWK
jgi:hypothetical protein